MLKKLLLKVLEATKCKLLHNGKEINQVFHTLNKQNHIIYKWQEIGQTPCKEQPLGNDGEVKILRNVHNTSKLKYISKIVRHL